MPSITATRAGLWDSYRDYQQTYMAVRNFAEATRRGYASDLRLFLEHLANAVGVTTVHEIERTHLLDYFAELDRRGRAGATRARKMAAVKSFFGYLQDSDVIERNLIKGMPRPRQEVKEPRVLTEEEHIRLRRMCEHNPRDRALIELFLQTGLRLSEVATLTLSDLKLPPQGTAGAIGAVTVNGKGRKRRTVSLNWKACQAVSAYLAHRQSTRESAVFLSRAGKSLTPRAIQRIVKRYMERAGISRASVHTLRHTFATHMVRKGTNLRVIQEALGHTSLQTTSLYVSLARDLMDQQLQANAL